MKIYSTGEVKNMINQINNNPKPTLYEGKGISYEKLGDREFEILIYQLFKRHKVEKDKKYDRIELMSGVAEKGRDSVLYKKNKPIGIIQCKHTEKNTSMDTGQAAKEIIKFILYCIKTKELIPDTGDIDYYFVHSYRFNEVAQKFLANFNIEIIKDMKRLEEWTKSVINKYSNLKGIVYEDIKDKLLKLIPRICINKLEQQDIDLLIQTEDDIIATYFQVRKVIVEGIKLPREYEGKELTENDVKKVWGEKFILKLNEIRIKQRDLYSSIQDYWNTMKTLELVNNIEYIDIKAIESYQQDLKYKYNLLYDTHSELMGTGIGEEEIRQKSRNFYREILGQEPLKIIGVEENRMFFQRGMYQDIANTPQIPTWKLKEYKEDENEFKYDDILQLVKGNE